VGVPGCIAKQATRPSRRPAADQGSARGAGSLT
jgi:hypothetical protein